MLSMHVYVDSSQEMCDNRKLGLNLDCADLHFSEVSILFIDADPPAVKDVHLHVSTFVLS
jgi:hypothetical protein